MPSSVLKHRAREQPFGHLWRPLTLISFDSHSGAPPPLPYFASPATAYDRLTHLSETDRSVLSAEQSGFLDTNPTHASVEHLAYRQLQADECNYSAYLFMYLIEISWLHRPPRKNLGMVMTTASIDFDRAPLCLYSLPAALANERQR